MYREHLEPQTLLDTLPSVELEATFELLTLLDTLPSVELEATFEFECHS